MEACQCDELELVAHGTELALELGDGGIVEVLFPVERRRAVIRQHLARELGMDGVSKLLGEGQIRLAGLTPDQIGVFGIGQTA